MSVYAMKTTKWVQTGCVTRNVTQSVTTASVQSPTHVFAMTATISIRQRKNALQNVTKNASTDFALYQMFANVI